jgi:parvulin-like peptidyl-prolyl isomerase
MQKRKEKELVNIRTTGLSLTLAACLSGAASAQQPAAGDAVIGKMGNVEVKTSDVRRIIDAQPPEVRKQIAGGVSELDRLVRNELVRQALLAEAKAKGLDKKPDVMLIMDRAREQALLQVYMNDVARPPANFPSEEDVKQAYEANKAQLAVPAQFELAQIFVSSPEGADKAVATRAQKKAADVAAKAQVKGADFAKLAKENSEHKDTAPKGGDLGWLPENQIFPEIRVAVVKMEKGDVSGPIRSASGWHIVKLVDKRPAGVRPLSEVQDAIANQLRMRRAQEIERSYVEGLIGRTPQTVNQLELSKLQSAK